MPCQTTAPPPIFQESPDQVLAAIFWAGSSKPADGSPGTVKNRHSCLPVAES